MLCGEPSFAINDILRKLYDGGTINKILSFQQEIDDLLADNNPFDAVLYTHGLLTPFRLPAISYNAFYDPNRISYVR